MTTALFVVDAQRNMLEGGDPVPSADSMKDVLADVISRARNAGAVVVHVQNNGAPGDPDEPHTAGWELVFPPASGEPVVEKDSSDTFSSNPDLVEVLRSERVDRVVVVGMQSEFCVAATSRGALGHGFGVVLPRLAHATYDADKSARQVSEDVETELAAEGVSVVDLGELSFE